MPISTASDLVDFLRQSPLLDAKQLQEVASLATTSTDLKECAREIVRRGWLTPWQINQIGKGKGQELILGGYVLVQLLGEGGMGQVFKAWQKRLQRQVALKIIRKEYLASPSALERFQREAQAAARLAHPNIVTVFDAGEIQGTHFLAMEFLDGQDLAQVVKERGPLAIAPACAYIRQAALGLQHAHEQGLVHRDIKPSNLMLTRQGTVKVMDMGLARLNPVAGGAAAGGLTTTGAVMGTPDYIAPEQAINARNVDIRADIYSLGCSLYFLLTARPPFVGESLTEKLLKHQLEEPVPIAQLRPEVPAGVTAVVRQLMAKRPQDRYQTPAEAAAALEPCTRLAALVPDARGGAPQAIPIPVRANSATATQTTAEWPAETPRPDPTLTSIASPAAGRPGRRLWWLGIGGGLLAGATLLVVAAWLLRPAGSSGPEKPAVSVTSARRPEVPVVLVKATAFSENGEYDKALAELDRVLQSDPKYSAAHVLRAWIAILRGQYHQATADCDRAIQLDPKSPLAHAYRGLARSLASSDYDPALADCVRAVQLDPDSAAAQACRAWVQIEKREYDKALVDCARAIQLDPRYAFAYFVRSLAHAGKREADKAFADSDEAIRLSPKTARFYQARSYALRGKKDLDRALADCDLALQLDPQCSPLHRSRGLIFLDRKEYDRALTCFDEAIRLNPRVAVAYADRARTYREKKEPDKALADCDQAIQLDPNRAMLYAERGGVYFSKKDWDKAIADYDRAIQLDPKNIAAYSSRAAALNNKGQYDLAIAESEKVIQLDPRHAHAYYTRAYAYNRKAMYDKVVAECDECLRIEPGHAGALELRKLALTNLRNRAVAARRKEDYVKAQADFNELIRLDPQDPANASAFAWFLATCPDAKFRDGKKAVQHASKACEAMSWKDPASLDILAAAHAEAGDFEEAVKSSKKALELLPAANPAGKKYSERLKLYEDRKQYRE